MSSLNARGEFALKVTGKGAVELDPELGKASVRGAVFGWSWHTVLFAHALEPLPIVAPEPLKIVSCGLAKVRLRPV